MYKVVNSLTPTYLQDLFFLELATIESEIRMASYMSLSLELIIFGVPLVIACLLNL